MRTGENHTCNFWLVVPHLYFNHDLTNSVLHDVKGTFAVHAAQLIRYEVAECGILVSNLLFTFHAGLLALLRFSFHHAPLLA